MKVDLTKEDLEVAIRALICANDYCSRANNIRELLLVNNLRSKLARFYQGAPASLNEEIIEAEFTEVKTELKELRDVNPTDQG